MGEEKCEREKMIKKKEIGDICYFLLKKNVHSSPTKFMLRKYVGWVRCQSFTFYLKITQIKKIFKI